LTQAIVIDLGFYKNDLAIVSSIIVVTDDKPIAV
jgi:hypothetical protein